MRVFVAGATGVAGRRAVRQLVAAGHSVVGVARIKEKADFLRDVGATPLQVNLFDAAAARDAVRGCDAIVNLATKIPPLNRAMLPGAWRENNRIRRQMSRNLVDAAIRGDVEVYVQESLAFIYPDRGDEWIDESVGAAPPRYARTTLVAEDQGKRFGDYGGTGIVLRFGQFYAPDASHTRSMIRTARRRLSPFPGPRDAFFPVVHADDVATAVVAALEAPSGTYNVVDDEPLRQGELAQLLAAAVDSKTLRFAPAGLMRLGGAKVRMLMRSQRVSNRRLRSATTWTPAFRSAREGLPGVVGETLRDDR